SLTIMVGVNEKRQYAPESSSEVWFFAILCWFRCAVKFRMARINEQRRFVRSRISKIGGRKSTTSQYQWAMDEIRPCVYQKNANVDGKSRKGRHAGSGLYPATIIIW